MKRTLATLSDATLRGRTLTILDPDGAPVIAGQLLAHIPVGDRVTVRLEAEDGGVLEVGPLPGETVCLVGSGS